MPVYKASGTSIQFVPMGYLPPLPPAVPKGAGMKAQAGQGTSQQGALLKLRKKTPEMKFIVEGKGPLIRCETRIALLTSVT